MSTPLRVLCLSNMWPGEADPDYGAFVADMCGALERRGMSVEPVVIDHRGKRRRADPGQVRRPHRAGGARGPAGRRDLRPLPLPHGRGGGPGGADRAASPSWSPPTARTYATSTAPRCAGRPLRRCERRAR